MQSSVMRLGFGVCVLVLMLLIITASLTPLYAQNDGQQETVDAIVDSYFTQTATAYEALIASATARPAYNLTLTATTTLGEAVTRAFYVESVSRIETQQAEILATAGAVATENSFRRLTPNTFSRLITLHTFESDVPVSEGEFSPDSQLFAAAYDSGDIVLWDVSTGESVNVLLGHENTITGLMFSPDGRMLVSAEGFLGSNRLPTINVRIWDIATGQTLHILYGHESEVIALSFSSDSLRLVTVSRLGEAFVWNTLTGDLLYRLSTETLRRYEAVAYSQSRDVILVVDSGFNYQAFGLPETEGRLVQNDDQYYAGSFDGWLWDGEAGRDFGIRRGAIVYNENFLRFASADRSIGISGRILSVDNGNTLLATTDEYNVYIWAVLRGERGQAIASETAVMFAQETKTAEAGNQTSTATAAIARTSLAATNASVSDLAACDATVVDDAGDILRIVHQEPSTDTTFLRAVRGGTVVEVRDSIENEDGIWYEIYENNRRIGFVLSEYVILSC